MPVPAWLLLGLMLLLNPIDTDGGKAGHEGGSEEGCSGYAGEKDGWKVEV